MGDFTNALITHTGLQDRFRYSKQFLSNTRGNFCQLPGGINPVICVFAAGSLGRYETGRISDLDLFILADRRRKPREKSVSKLQEIELFSDLIKLNEALKLPPFSGDGRFLKVHELTDLIQATGDAKDDSENLFTTRLLLLLESRPISNDELYKKALNRVLNNYFRDGKDRSDFHPLFLLNDILRYWRTLCLNYERDRGLAKPWWKKNLNLKFSRKLTIFSSVLAILAKQVTNADEFFNLTQKVPLERLAFALDQINDQNLLPDFELILDDYESFLAAKSHAELEEKDMLLLEELKQKADHFGSFLYRALHSPNLDQSLVKYLAI